MMHCNRRPAKTDPDIRAQGYGRIRGRTEMETVHARDRSCRSRNRRSRVGYFGAFSVRSLSSLRALAFRRELTENFPPRLVTKMTLHRTGPASLTSPLPFPPDSFVSIHSPLTRLSSKWGQRPRRVALSQIRLLGPLSESPKPYHPLIRPDQGSKKQGVRALSLSRPRKEKVS